MTWPLACVFIAALMIVPVIILTICLFEYIELKKSGGQERAEATQRPPRHRGPVQPERGAPPLTYGASDCPVVECKIKTRHSHIADWLRRIRGE